MRDEVVIKESPGVEAFAIKVVEYFFPTFIEGTHEEDTRGIDGHIGEESIQVRGDRRMIDTGNLIYQKEYLPDWGGDFKEVIVEAETLMQVTWNEDKGFLIIVPVQVIKDICKHLTVRRTRFDSYSYLVPLSKLPPNSFQKLEYSIPFL